MNKLKFLKEHGAVKLAFRALPVSHQLAMIRYMAVDGEAWDHPTGFDTAKNINNFLRNLFLMII